MLGVILNWIGGGVIGQIGDQLNSAYKAKLEAKNDEDRIAAEVKIETLSAQRDVLVAEQNDRLTKWIRPAFALPFVLYIWKVIVWDNLFGLGTTDPISQEMSWVMSAIVGAYFLTRPFEKRGRK